VGATGAAETAARVAVVVIAAVAETNQLPTFHIVISST